MRTFSILAVCAVLMLCFVYLMITPENTPKKRVLPFYGVDSITKGGDTIWHTVGEFKLISQRSDTVSQKNLYNNVYVADFFFVNCPGICIKMGKQLTRIYDAYKDKPEVKIVSHTVNPENDSVAVLLDYAQKQGVTDHTKWIFLTGDKSAIYKLAREQYYATATQGDGGADDFVHTERFTLVDKNKHIRGFYDGTNESEVNQMMFDIDKLLAE